MSALAPAAVASPACSPAPSGLAVVELDPLRLPEWDSLLATHPGASFFHSAPWARTLATAYGFTCRYLAVLDGTRLLGLFPLMEARSWLRGTRGVGLPFTDECPLLVSDAVSASRLYEAADRLGRDRGWKFLELRGSAAAFPEAPPAVSFYDHTIPLDGSVAENSGRWDASVRRAVRKAERSGVTVSFSSDWEQVAAYYQLHCRTRTRHGAPPQPLRFFRAVFDHILRPGHGFVALAQREGQLLAGAVFFQFGRRALYKFGASDERFQEWRGMNLVFARALARFSESGAAELNLGKTSFSNEGLRRFKLGWGARERTVSYLRYSFEHQAFVQIADLASGIQARFMALMPVTLSRWMGQVLYAHLT